MSECDCPLKGESYAEGNPEPCNAEGPDANICSKPNGHDGPHAACGVAQHPVAVWEGDDA